MWYRVEVFDDCNGLDFPFLCLNKFRNNAKRSQNGPSTDRNEVLNSQPGRIDSQLKQHSELRIQ